MALITVDKPQRAKATQRHPVIQKAGLRLCAGTTRQQECHEHNGQGFHQEAVSRGKKRSGNPFGTTGLLGCDHLMMSAARRQTLMKGKSGQGENDAGPRTERRGRRE
ncbi:hypothetical protein GCM10010082_24490 [Kushneria pakistanensis]|uniref:Uncharacterized protein n=1 Tax=Kushneria pakistanensis TaxID=1508770 RepID=A0ABQ3FMB1_9GAMM|nr:hypothetical protein GCM10010082_24490 [Kushneria pakistanensis]